MAQTYFDIVFRGIYRAGQAFSKADSDIEKTTQKTEKFKRGLKAIDVVLSSIAVGGALSFANSLVHTAAQMEKNVLQLAVFERSVDGAKKKFQQLQTEYGKTGFALDEVTKAQVRFQAAGIENSDSVIKSTLDALKASGGGDAELSRASTAITQIASKGVLQMEELRGQLSEAIPFAARIMARELGLSMSEMVLEIEKGNISAERSIAAFTTGIEKNFGGASTRIKSLEGSLSGLDTAWKQTVARTFNDTSLGARLALVFDKVGDSIIAFGESIDEADIEAFWKQFLNVVSAAEGVTRAIGGIAVAVAGFASQISGLLSSQLSEVAAGGLVGFILFGRQKKTIDAIASVIIGVVLSISSSMSSFSSTLGQTMQSMMQVSGGLGALAFMVFGPSGALIGAVIGAGIEIVARSLIELSHSMGAISDAKYDEVWDKINRSGSVTGAVLGDLAEASRTAQTGMDSLTGSLDRAAQGWEKVRSANEAFFRQLKEFESQPQLTTTQEKVVSGLATLANRVQAQLDQANGGSAAVTRDRQSLESAKKVLAELEKRRDEADQAMRGQNMIGDTAGAKAARKAFAEWTMLNGEIASVGEQINLVEKNINVLSDTHSAKVGDRMAKEMDNILDRARKTVNEVSKLYAAETGNGLESQLIEINAAYAERVDSLNEALAAIQKSDQAEGAYRTQVEAINVAKQQLVALLGQQESKTRAIYALEQANQGLAAKGTILGVQQQMRELQDLGGGKSLMAQIFGTESDVMRQVREQSNELYAQILDTQQKINSLEIERLSASDANVKAIDDQIAAYQRLLPAIEEQRAALSTDTILTKEFATAWREDIGNGVEAALQSMAHGFQNLGDVANSVWESMTASVTRYLAKQAEAKLFGNLLEGGSGEGGLMGMIGGLFANGGVFKGKIKPFADGGLIRGPTMFGLAGEAGHEAIMPLKRGRDGKLGVAGSGGGGGDVHIHVNAIDTRSGVEFVMSHKETIMGGIRDLGRRNKGLQRR